MPRPIQPDGIGRKGRFYVNADLEIMLQSASVRRESMVDYPGIYYIRRSDNAG
jgi:hypothetical protein